MWLLVLLVAVSVVVTVVARRRHTDEQDSVDAQRRRTDALRTAVGQHEDSSDLGDRGNGGGIGLATMSRTRRDRSANRSVLGTALIAVAVVIAGVAVYALAAGWDSTSRSEDDAGSADRTTGSSSTTTSSTSSTSSTTTTTTPAVPTVLSAENGNVVVSVPSGPYQLNIAATDPCWTQVARADGTVVETQTMQAGDVIDLNESGALTIRLGNPTGVQITIDGTALTLPPAGGSTVRVALVPATER